MEQEINSQLLKLLDVKPTPQFFAQLEDSNGDIVKEKQFLLNQSRTIRREKNTKMKDIQKKALKRLLHDNIRKQKKDLFSPQQQQQQQTQQ